MANMLGTRLLVRPGEELLCDASAHVVRAELGGHAAFGAVTTRTFHGPAGRLDVAAVDDLAAPDGSPHLVRTGAVAVENTHNFGGGTIQPLEVLTELRAWAQGCGVRLHMDGARLWNAHVATGTAMAEYGRLFDTVAVCLSKGLGAPIGSLLVGPDELIAEARWWRKRMGGGMRQVGVLAAAGLYALDHHIERLAEDHEHARLLAGRLGEVLAGVATPETNIVVVDLAGAPVDGAELAAQAKANGVLISVLGPRLVRLVTHLDVEGTHCRRAADVLCDLLRS